MVMKGFCHRCCWCLVDGSVAHLKIAYFSCISYFINLDFKAKLQNTAKYVLFRLLLHTRSELTAFEKCLYAL